ncbi:hypothetical protein RhiJN_24117 [Ceratobasidium sp. AG-Ba]|nr:hypothetical protein RhiJN_24117 [Ceratobasidium sp. AG-Ba]
MSLSDIEDSTTLPGPCEQPVCQGKCQGFVLNKKKVPDLCKCGHGAWFHKSYDDEEGLAEEEDEEEEDQDDEGGLDDMDRDREAELKAHFKLATFTDQKLANPLQSASRSFKGSISGKAVQGRGSAKAVPVPKIKSPVKPAVSSSSTVVTKTRKPSGPKLSNTRAVGGLFLHNRALEHVQTQATAHLEAGWIRITRQHFNRSTLGGLGLRLSHPSHHIELNRTWSMEQFDEFVLSQFPQIFNYVRSKMPEDYSDYLWILFTRQGQELHQSTCSEVDLDMSYVWDEVFKDGKGVKQQELWLGTKINIPDTTIRQLLGRSEPETLRVKSVGQEMVEADREVAADKDKDSEDSEAEIYTGRITRARANSRDHILVPPIISTKRANPANSLGEGPKPTTNSPVKRSCPTPEPEVNRQAKKTRPDQKAKLAESDSDRPNSPLKFAPPASPAIVNLVSPSPSPIHPNPWTLVQDLDLEDDLANF